MSNAGKPDKVEEKKSESKEGAKPAKKGLSAKHKQIIIFATAGLVFIGLITGSTMFLLKSLNEEDPAAALEAKEESAEAAKESHDASKSTDSQQKTKPEAVYIAMQPAFVVNFEGSAEQHFMQVEVTLLSHDPAVEDSVKTHMPLLRNALVMLFGSQSYDDMQTMEGKEKLRQQALVDLQAILKKEVGKTAVEDIFFTSIVMQ